MEGASCANAALSPNHAIMQFGNTLAHRETQAQEHSSLPALIVRSTEPAAKEPKVFQQEEKRLPQGVGFD